MKSFDFIDTQFWEYLKKNSAESPQKLMLRDSAKNYGFPIDFAITQLECRRKVARKLEVFLRSARFLFPSVLAAEQATHQCVAAYHASLVGVGYSVLDMTAGLGIDTMTIAAAGNDVTTIELDADKAMILNHNIAEAYSVPDKNISVITADSIRWLEDRGADETKFDVIFVDPARRDDAKRRTYFFADCRPDIVGARQLLLNNAVRIFIKSSPIVDITQALREFPEITEFHIVCINNECKEVLAIADAAAPSTDPVIVVVDLDDNRAGEIVIKSRFECRMSELSNEAPIAQPDELQSGKYLYDPNAGLHKINCASVLCKTYGDMKRVSPNTDLYVSPTYYKEFQGRIFEIYRPIDKKEAKALAGKKREVAVRNYPLTAEELRKKLKVRPGGFDEFIWAMRVGQCAHPLILSTTRLY